MLFQTIKNFREYKVDDYSATVKLLIDGRNDLLDSIEYNIERIEQKINQNDHTIILRKNIQNTSNLSTIYPEYDFNSIFPYCKLSSSCLKNLHIAASSIENGYGIEWIKNNGIDVFQQYNHELYTKILHHPLISENGHTGSSIRWTVRTLHKIYNDGWNGWIQQNPTPYL